MMKVSRVLLVDDDADDSELFLEAVHELDSSMICTTSPDGVHALQKLRSQEPPDLIFLDINMPKMDGWQLLEVIKNDAALKEIPVIMYSTSVKEREIAKAVTLGAKMLFSKPESFSELKKTLQQLINIA